jgi:hypothetical protein
VRFVVCGARTGGYVHDLTEPWNRRAFNTVFGWQTGWKLIGPTGSAG